MTTIRDDRAGLEIEVGDLLAKVSGRRGKKPRWTELRLWRTLDGLYAIEKVGRSMVIGERDRLTAWICGDLAHVRQSAGKGPLSWRLLQRAGILRAERHSNPRPKPDQEKPD